MTVSSFGNRQERQGRTEDFDFELPEALIAQQPANPREEAKLLALTCALGAAHFRDLIIADLPALLRPSDILVLNDTKVIPARLYGRRGAMKAEILLHKQQPDGSWFAFARPGKRLRVGEIIIFRDDLSAVILGKRESGEVHLQFSETGADLFRLLDAVGEPPLPPYIRREDGAARGDKTLYQTVYAREAGAIAAPTAGLHFTSGLLAKCAAAGLETVTVTLHVGAGTFLPVKAEKLEDHVMHAEWGEITEEAADRLNAAKRAGCRIVAVGTTSLRLLESATSEDGVIRAFQEETDIFISPGYRFRAVDALLTNFHLPRSTLFMLVSAFGGLDTLRSAYAHAIRAGYRFYSYGDAMFLEHAQNPQKN